MLTADHGDIVWHYSRPEPLTVESLNPENTMAWCYWFDVYEVRKDWFPLNELMLCLASQYPDYTPPEPTPEVVSP